MCIHDKGKQQFLSLGRLERKDVRKKMDAVYKEVKPKDYVEKVDKCTFSDLMELWYLDVVVPRLPEAKIRDEFKLINNFKISNISGVVCFNQSVIAIFDEFN